MEKTAREPESFILNNSSSGISSLGNYITITYLIALALIATLAIAGYLGVSSFEKIHQNGLDFSKVVAKQKMLTQRIGLLALLISVESNKEKRLELKTLLTEEIAEMKKNQESLIKKNYDWNILTEYSDSTKEKNNAYLNPPIELNTRINNFLSRAIKLTQTEDSKISLKNDDLAYLVTMGSESLLESIEFAEKSYEKISKSRRRFLRTLELSYLVTTLVILGIEALYIFNPMVQKIKYAIKKLQLNAKEMEILIETVGDGILKCNENGIIIDLNKEIERLWQSKKTDLLGQPIHQLFVVKDSSFNKSNFLLPSDIWVEKIAKSYTGEEFAVEVHQNHIILKEKVISVIAIRDIRKRKSDEESIQQSLDEKQVLLQEIHHRVKNNLQVISSFLSMQSRNNDDQNVKLLFQESKNRVDTMSLIHEELYKSKNLSTIDFGRYITDLVTNLIHTYVFQSSDIQLKVNAEKAFFNIDTAIPCGLIINEIVSNSLKHAFTGIKQKAITINLQKNDDNKWNLEISDNGKGIDPTIDITKSNSMGFRLIHALVSQLKGTIEYF